MTQYLLDTNILLRSRDLELAYHGLVNDTLSHLISQDHSCYITSQVLVEFWVVATRPLASNGLGWTIEETTQALQLFINLFGWLAETPEIFP
jgi:predicted nucleic-acid-binding protein